MSSVEDSNQMRSDAHQLSISLTSFVCMMKELKETSAVHLHHVVQRTLNNVKYVTRFTKAACWHVWETWVMELDSEDELSSGPDSVKKKDESSKVIPHMWCECLVAYVCVRTEFVVVSSSAAVERQCVLYVMKYLSLCVMFVLRACGMSVQCVWYCMLLQVTVNTLKCDPGAQNQS